MNMSNKIICVGSNFYGQLGIGNRIRSHPPYIPTQFGNSSSSGSTSIVKSSLHSAIAKASGNEEEESYITATNSIDANSVKDVQCGSTFTTMLDSDGKVKICGYIHGLSFATPTMLPISTPLACVQVACGYKHVLLLMEGGYVLSFGCGYFGQLGHGDDSSCNTPKVITSLDPTKKYLDNDGVVTSVVCGPFTSGFIITSTNNTTTRSNTYSAGSTQSHVVYMCGLNASGQCGMGAQQKIEKNNSGSDSTKIIVRPTLIAMPVFDYATSNTDADMMKNRNNTSNNRVLPFGMKFGSKKSSAVDRAPICGSIQLVLAKHHSVMLHVPTNRVYSWGSTLYGQLGLASLGNNDTINVANIGIGSGNANSMNRRRVHNPTEVVISGVTGGIDIPIQLPGLNKVVSVTGVVSIPPGKDRLSLTYIVDIVCGEHHNMIHTTTIPLQPVTTAASPNNSAGGTGVNAHAAAYIPTWLANPAGKDTAIPSTDVYSWGYNLEGQCGHIGNIMHVKCPRVLEYFHENELYVTNVYAGMNYSLSISRDLNECTPAAIPLLLPDNGKYQLYVDTHLPNPNPNAVIHGWGYCDGGWLGLVVPPLNSLPFIDADNVSPAGYNFTQAKMFDCNCIVMSPTRVKSLVPTVYNNSRPSSAVTTTTATGGLVDSASSPAPGYYVPSKIRCGSTHTVVFLKHVLVAPIAPLASQTSSGVLVTDSSSRHLLSPALSSSSIDRSSKKLKSMDLSVNQNISSDSEDEGAAVNSKLDAKKSGGVKSPGGLFGNKSSALAGKFNPVITAPTANSNNSSSSSAVVKPIVNPSAAANMNATAAVLFHILKYHSVPTALPVKSIGTLSEVFIAHITRQEVLWSRDAEEDGNTLLISACKYLMNAIDGTTRGISKMTSHATIRREIMCIIQYLLHHTFVPVTGGGYQTIINEANKDGNTALHYCFYYKNNDSEQVNPSPQSITGATIGEYILSLNNKCIRYQGEEIVVQVNDFITNAVGLTCYEGIHMNDLDQLT